VLLGSGTANNTAASLDFTSLISSTYDDYVFEVLNLLPASSGDILLKVSTDNGGTWLAGTNYATVNWGFASGGGVTSGTATDSSVHIATGNSIKNDATEQGLSGTFHLYNPLNTAGWKHILGHVVWWDNSGVVAAAQIDAMVKTATAIDAVQFVTAGGGNLTSGIIRLYGLTH
jgi:hypothetical protein